MKTIKFKNVALFAFAFAATAFVSSCSSDDDTITSDNTSNEQTMTIKMGVSDKLNGDELTRASYADAATPVLEQNVDLGNSITAVGTQIVDETVMNTFNTRSTYPTKSHLKLSDIDYTKASGSGQDYNKTNQIGSILCYWFKGDEAIYFNSGTNKGKSYSTIKVDDISDNGDGTLTAPVTYPKGATKVVMYIGTSTLEGTDKFGTVKVSQVYADGGSFTNAGDSPVNYRRGIPANRSNKFEAFYAGAIPTESPKLINFTRLAARIRVIVRNVKGSSYQDGTNAIFFSQWEAYFNNTSSPTAKLTANLRGDYMKDVKITDEEWNKTFTNNSIVNRSEFLYNEAYFHCGTSQSSVGSATDKGDDRDWYIAQRDNSGSKFASSVGNAENTWLSTLSDKQKWHDRFDVWYNFIPAKSNAPTGTYTGKYPAKSYNLSDYFIIEMNRTYLNDALYGAKATGSDRPDIIFKLPTSVSSDWQKFLPGHSYTLYVYVNIAGTDELATFQTALKNGTIKPFNFNSIN